MRNNKEVQKFDRRTNRRQFCLAQRGLKKAVPVHHRRHAESKPALKTRSTAAGGS